MLKFKDREVLEIKKEDKRILEYIDMKIEEIFHAMKENFKACRE